jgi:hypothetical protein
MAKIRMTSLVAPYIDDINNKKLAGYTWSNIVDLLSDSNVIDRGTQAQTLRHATISNPYAEHVEQRLIPIPIVPTASSVAVRDSANVQVPAQKRTVAEMVQSAKERVRPVFPDRSRLPIDEISQLVEEAKQANRKSASDRKQYEVVDLT